MIECKNAKSKVKATITGQRSAFLIIYSPESPYCHFQRSVFGKSMLDMQKDIFLQCSMDALIFFGTRSTLEVSQI